MSAVSSNLRGLVFMPAMVKLSEGAVKARALCHADSVNKRLTSSTAWRFDLALDAANRRASDLQAGLERSAG